MKDFLSELIKKDIHIDLVEGELSVKFPKNGIDPTLLEEIKIRKPGIIKYLNDLKENEFVIIPALTGMDSYPVSNAQRRLWVLSQFEGGSVAYNMPGNIYLNKDIDIGYFKKAIESTIERHEVLRTVFREDKAGEIRQWVLNKADLGFKIDYKDFRKEQNRQELVKLYLQEDSYKLFDLEKGPLLRAALLQVEDEKYVFYYNMHHIVSDGWSMEVLSKDVLAYYEAYKENREPALKQLRIQYKDYSAWQLDQLKEESFKTHREYWLNSLSGELPLLNLPGIKQRPRIKTNKGISLSAYIDSNTTGKLKNYSELNGGSLFMCLLATWNVLMYRYTSQKDIIIGTPVAGREHADLEDQIGFYVNTLALRNEINPEESFHTFYKALTDNTLNSYAHQVYPFDKLVEELKLQRDTSRSAVFDVMLMLHNTGEKPEGGKLTKQEISQVTDRGDSVSKFDIDLSFQEVGDYLSLQVVFNPDVYEKEMVEGLIHHYRHLLSALLENPEEKISQIDFLSKEEKHQLLHTFNATEAEYAKDKTVLDLFEDQVARTPDHIAVAFEEKELTYRELNEQSNQLAAYLQKNYKIKPDDLAGIKQPRSEWMIISVLAVLKSGGAYVPIDPEYPQERIDYIEKDTLCKVCIDEEELDKFRKTQKKYPKEKPDSLAGPEHLSHVIYTSGSTGRPKGVMIEHESTYSFIKWSHDEFAASDFDTVLFTTSLNFDLSVFEIFHTLTKGKTLRVIKDGLSIPQHLADGKKLLINTVPSVVGALLQQGMSFESVSVLNMAGEPIPANYKTELKGKVKEIRNLYGPSEDTTYSTVIRIDRDGRDLIGKPISNTRIYIVSEEKKLQPTGVIGEICIGGVGLARGYLNEEKLTHEKFIENPFKEGERLYRTGDLGRWLADGNIEFIGRKDYQVKIRGYRIELGEIEHALLSNGEIKEAVVLAKENAQNEKALVAYITAKSDQNINALRSYLKELLPEFMLPASYVQLEAMPLTPNGKIDKNALPDPKGLALSSGVDYVAPRSEKEKLLVLVWTDVLKRERIGVKDSFYNLGGDSIKSIQVVSRLKQKGYTLKVEHILRTPVLEELARLMQQAIQVIDQKEISGRVELTPIQHWFFENPLIKVHNHFNQSVMLKSKEQLDKDLVKKCITELTKHHDALRMVYENEAGTWKPINKDTKSKSYTLDFYDLRKTANALEQMSQIGEALQSGIDITQGPLLRVVHFRLKDGDRLGLIAHHLVVDGVSWRILLEDLSVLYTSYKEGIIPVLPLKTDSFQRWALLQKEYVLNKRLQKEKGYWEELCSKKIERLPQDKELGEALAIIDSGESFSLDKQTTELLQTHVHSVYNTEINDVLLTGLGLAIKEVLASDKSVIKMEGHGREEILPGVDISRTVGWFTSMYPFVLDVSKAVNQIESLIGVKESLRRVPNKGIGYGMLKYLSPEGLQNKLDPEIIFNYLGDFGSNVSGAGKNFLFDYVSEHIGAYTSKENGSEGSLDVSGMLVMGELSMSIRYSQHKYTSATIQKLVKSYEKNLKFLIKELAAKKETYLTPSDLSFKGLSIEELSRINSDIIIEDVYELSPLQEGIYYHWLSEESSALYFEQMSYRVKAKELEIEKLKQAYDSLVSRHGILRTSFSNEYGGRSLQIVRKAVPSNFTYERTERLQDKQIYVEKIKQNDREKGFDLNALSQMRLHVIDLREGEYEFIWSFHHILMDGWGLSVLINDFNELLSAGIMGKIPVLSPVIPYSNYINWLGTTDRESSKAYWKEYLADYSQVAEIPFKIKAVDKTYVECREQLCIDGALFKQADALCNRIGITHNIFIQGVWGYLLSCYNFTNDVVFGAVVSGRPAELPGVEDMIGLFINTIPVRVRYEPGQSPVELLKALQEQSIQSTSHHHMNLSEVQSQSELGVNLMTHILMFQNYAIKVLDSEGILNTQREEGLSIESIEVFAKNNYDFRVAISTSSTSLNIDIRYNSNSLDSVSLKRLINHFGNLIRQFTESVEQPLSTFNYLSEEEKNELLFAFNNTAVEYPKDKTIIDLFEKQAAKTPNNIAVVFNERALSYKMLDTLSNQLANYLRKNYTINPDDLIGIQLMRSEWMIISILGVMKAGGAYVPIDPEYPSSRKEYIVKDTSLKLLITESGFVHDMDYYEGEVFAIDVEFEPGECSSEKISKSPTIRDLAYIIYTSGTIGKPKGVMIEHSGLVNMAQDHIRKLGLSASDKILQFVSFCFDGSVLDTFMTFLSGGTLVILGQDTIADHTKFLHYIEEQRITVMTLPPVYLRALNRAALDRVRVIITAGESAHVPDAEYYAQTKNFYNAYGPTEGTVNSTLYKVDPSLRYSTIPIGRTADNKQIYILNDSLQLQASGVVGEICIGGAGLARGYLNQEELTKEKFIKNPFRKGERLYKTGDLGRWTKDGTIEFTGRKDEQVKIRGYRIELGEIEYALQSNTQLKEVVVLAKANQDNEKELVAYITAKEKQNTSELRAYLKERLPEYMLPAYFVQLESMPLTTNGKIDKKSLPEPQGLGLASGVNYVAPRNEIEEKLVKIWEDVLQKENIGVTDDFFVLGGHSLKAIRVISKIQKEYNIKFELGKMLQEVTTIEKIAEFISLVLWDYSNVDNEMDEFKI